MKPKYSICTDAVFRGMDSVEAIEGVKAAGFEYYEFWRYIGKDLQAMKARGDSIGVKCISCSGKAKPANLNDPREHAEWIEILKGSIEAAKVLGNKQLVVVPGNDTGARRDFQHKAIVKALKMAVPVLVESNITLVVEPLNGRVDHAGTYLEYSDEGFEIVEEVGSDNVKLLFDIYHQQITEGDILRRMLPRIKQIGHIHTAGSKGRNELDIGELNYPKIIEAICEAGYDGYIGFEYMPAGDSLTGLKRMFDYLPK
jgi:hydroxypyruvate isomerase